MWFHHKTSCKCMRLARSLLLVQGSHPSSRFQVFRETSLCPLQLALHYCEESSSKLQLGNQLFGSAFFKHSLHSGSWCNCALPFLAQKRAYQSSFTSDVPFLAPQRAQTKASNFPKNSSVTDHSSPSLANTSWNSLFFQIIFSGFTLPMPANELTESQPVKVCSPSKALHT